MSKFLAGSQGKSGDFPAWIKNAMMRFESDVRQIDAGVYDLNDS